MRRHGVDAAHARLLVLACAAAGGGGGAAGCDQLFKLDHLKTIAVDASPPCEDPTPFGTDCRTLALPLTNDTYLSESSPDTPLGTRDAIRISANEPGLFKFDTTAIGADERIADVTLTLDPNWTKNAKACSPSGSLCTLCPAPSIGSWSVAWTITGWSQTATTWNLADAPATPWAIPGAKGIPADRSEVVATGAAPTGDTQLVMHIPADRLLARSPNCYRSADRLALLVTIEGAAYFESSEVNNCDPAVENPATLTVTVCR